MLDERIGGLQLDDWADGSAVVSRRPGPDEAALAGPVPLSQDDLAFTTGMRKFSLIVLAVAVVTSAGGARLIHTGDEILGTAVGLVGAAIALFGALPGLLIHRHANRRALHVVLAPEAARTFRAAVGSEKRSLDPAAARADVKSAADRLWRLATTLSEAARPDVAEPTAVPSEAAPPAQDQDSPGGPSTS